MSEQTKRGKCHAKTRGVRKGVYEAFCRGCKWTGPRRTIFTNAWLDARQHDPEFPRGDRSVR